MAEADGNSEKKGFLRSAFKFVAGGVKELTIHSIIHFTLWGAIFASNFALFLAPVFDPLGQIITAGANSVGLGHLFTEAAGGMGASTLANSPALSNLPVLGG